MLWIDYLLQVIAKKDKIMHSYLWEGNFNCDYSILYSSIHICFNFWKLYTSLPFIIIN